MGCGGALSRPRFVISHFKLKRVWSAEDGETDCILRLDPATGGQTIMAQGKLFSTEFLDFGVFKQVPCARHQVYTTIYSYTGRRWLS